MGTEAGDFYKDALSPTNGRWTYEDPNIMINKDDTLHYWIYVQNGAFGYRLDSQQYSPSGIYIIISKLFRYDTVIISRICSCNNYAKHT